MADGRQSCEACPGVGLSRRSLLKRAAAASAGATLVTVIGGRARGDNTGATVKVVPEVDLKVLDPVWTTALITGTHALLVYDTLFAPDRQQRVHPQMVDKFARDEDGVTWRFELRGGLGWHDGTAVTARDCAASIRRWAARSASGKTMMERAEQLDATDDKFFVLKFKEPTRLVPETMGRSLAYMMREKDAETDPYTQIKSAIGSGPFSSCRMSGSPARMSPIAATPTTGRARSPPPAMPAARSPRSSRSSGRSSPTRRPRPPR